MCVQTSKILLLWIFEAKSGLRPNHDLSQDFLFFFQRLDAQFFQVSALCFDFELVHKVLRWRKPPFSKFGHRFEAEAFLQMSLPVPIISFPFLSPHNITGAFAADNVPSEFIKNPHRSNIIQIAAIHIRSGNVAKTKF